MLVKVHTIIQETLQPDNSLFVSELRPAQNDLELKTFSKSLIEGQTQHHRRREAMQFPPE